MTLKNTVGTLAHGAVNTAATAVRHPISTASMAAGLVKGTAEASVDFVRGVVRGEEPVAEKVADRAEAEDKVEVPAQRQEPAAEPEAGQPAATEVADVPREPEVVPKPVPAIDELPEPVVIEADDVTGEAFHTEPKAASRDSEHGGLPGDREEAEGYAEEIAVVNSGDISSETGEDNVVWTSESTEPAPEAADLPRST
jgi:hypothetical protein